MVTSLVSNYYLKKTNFTSFDRSISISTMHQKPDRFRMLLDNNKIFQIPRGAGLSYTPASFAKDTLVREMTSFNRIIEFDESSNIVIVESGISLQKLLKWCFGKELFFPVLPGWPEITVGGCLAANIHGKNPYLDGTFMDHVEWIELFHPSFGTKIISRSKEQKIFEATCGGLGLTGTILKVALHLKKLPSDELTIIPKKTESLSDTLSILENNKNQDVLYAWHIGSTFLNFGKGIVRIGTFSKKPDKFTLKIPKTKNINPKQLLPFSIWNNVTSSIINSINREMEGQKKNIQKEIFSGLFPFVDRESIFYSLYGKNGFNEYQLLIDEEHSNEFLNDLTLLIKSEKPSLTFLFLKLFKGKRKFLRFSGNGLSIILNLKHNNSTLNFLKKLDDLIISYKALPYLIKDSRLTKDVVEQCYPEYYEFKKILNEIDPKRIFRSELSERINL